MSRFRYCPRVRPTRSGPIVKKLIDYVGKDGGYIMDAAAHVTDAKIENVKAMFEFCREYGVY